MKIKDLEYFVALIKLKNFTAVADQFGVSQPTITYAVKRLEEEFDTKLIRRDQSHQSIIITDSGEQLNRHAVNILNEIQLTTNDMQISLQLSFVLDFRRLSAPTTSLN